MTIHAEQAVHDLAIRLDEENRRLRESIAAANARADAAEEAVFQNRKDREHYLATEESLAAARREIELLKTALAQRSR